MLRVISFSLILFLISNVVYSDNCDSIVVKKYYSEYSGEHSTVTRFVLDSLHRIIYDGNQFYEYDSLNRIVKHSIGSSYDSIVYSNPPGSIEDYLFQQGSSLELLRFIQQFSGVNQKDSVVYSYFYNAGVLTYHNRILYYYFSSDSLSQILTQEFDSLSLMYVTVDSAVYSWSPDYLFKTVNYYQWDGTMFQEYSVESARYNSSGEIESHYSSGNAAVPGFNINYWNECGIPYETNYSSVGGSGQDYYSSNTSWVFDSLCRPVSNSGSYENNSLGSSVNFNTEYYYADCNNILVIPKSIGICPGTVSYPNLEIYGGRGPLTYQWTPADSVSDATAANPALLGVTSQIYTLTITDQIGNTFTDSIDVYINSFSVVIYGASCATCSNGGIVVNSYHGNNEITIHPHVNPLQFPGVFVDILPRAYWVCVEAENCITCDSILVPDLSTLIQENVKGNLIIYPNPFTNQIIFKIDNVSSNNKWELYDVNGRLILNGIIRDTDTRVNTESISEGMYFLKIYQEQLQVVKLLKIE